MSFYIYLPSNGSHRYFPENTAANFRVKLPQTLDLTVGSYEVALTEITYVNSVKPFREDYADNVISVHLNHGEVFVVEVPIQHYHTVQDLIQTINRSIPTHQRDEIHFVFNSSENKVRIEFKSQNTSVNLSEKLSEILGFGGTTEITAEFCKASFGPDLRGGAYHMFVYADIIKPQIVGSSTVPLLRMINMRRDMGDVVTEGFPNPYYLPLSRNHIDVIGALLCDEFREEICLDRGQTTLVLHVREKQVGP